MYDDYFSKRLAELRIQKEVSAREMSLSLGQAAGYINNIENHNNLPSMTVFFYICEYLGVTPEEFFSKNTKAPTKLHDLSEELRHLSASQLDALLLLVKELNKTNF